MRKFTHCLLKNEKLWSQEKTISPLIYCFVAFYVSCLCSDWFIQRQRLRRRQCGSRPWDGFKLRKLLFSTRDWCVLAVSCPVFRWRLNKLSILHYCIATVRLFELWNWEDLSDDCIFWRRGIMTDVCYTSKGVDCGNKFYISTTATTLVHLSHRPRQSPIFSSDSLTLLHSPIVESTSSNKFNTNISFSRK